MIACVNLQFNFLHAVVHLCKQGKFVFQIFVPCMHANVHMQIDEGVCVCVCVCV